MRFTGRHYRLRLLRKWLFGRFRLSVAREQNHRDRSWYMAKAKHLKADFASDNLRWLNIHKIKNLQAVEKRLKNLAHGYSPFLATHEHGLGLGLVPDCPHIPQAEINRLKGAA